MKTDWNEQAQQMMRSWSRAQTELWQQWTEAAGRMGPSGAGGPPDWGEPWQDAMRRSMDAIAAGAKGAPREVVDKLFAGERVFLRFVDFWMQGFKTLAPKIEAGEDWAVLLGRYISKLKAEMTKPRPPWMTPEGAAAAARDLPELWKLYTAEAQKLVAPWLESLREARGHLGEAAAGDRSAPIKMFNIFMDTFEATLGKFTAAPAIGYTREFQEKLTRAFESWVDVRRAEVEFQTEVVNVGFRSLEDLTRRLVELGEKGEKITSFRQFLDLWVEASEKVFFEIASTDAFAQLQARLVNAAMHYRIHERDLAEEFLKALYLPTRRELDDAYKHMAHMRRDIKALKRDVEALRRGVTAESSRSPAPPSEAVSSKRLAAEEVEAGETGARAAAAASDAAAAPRARPARRAARPGATAKTRKEA